MDSHLLETLLKPPEIFTDEDKTLIRENEKLLNDEERVQFKDFLTETKPDPEPVVTPVVENEPIMGTPRPDERPSLTPEIVTSIIDDKIAAMRAAGATPAEQKKEEKKLIKFFAIDETDEWTVDEEGKRIPKDSPRNWNDVGNRIVDKLLENPDLLLERLAAPMRDKLIGMTRQEQEQERSEIQTINAGFDSEYDAIAKTGAIPARNTPEGAKVNAQIGLLGAKLGIDTYTQAYEVWRTTAKEFGGGYVPPNIEAIQEKAKLNKQKEAAARVGGGGGVPDQTPEPRKYKNLASRSFDQIQADALKR